MPDKDLKLSASRIGGLTENEIWGIGHKMVKNSISIKTFYGRGEIKISIVQKADRKRPSISSYSKEKYLEFFEKFFLLAHNKVKETTRIAFLNADWRDFESTPALKENSDNSITIFDYHGILSKTGWEVTHRIECPLSSERMSGDQVLKMQERGILGTVGRSLIIAKRLKNAKGDEKPKKMKDGT